MKTILMVGPQPPPTGGIETCIRQILESDLNKSYRFISVNDSKTPFIKKHKIMKYLFFMYNCSRVFFKCLIHRPSITHVHMSESFGFWRPRIFAKIAKLFNSKIILHMHAGAFPDFYDSLNKDRKTKVENTLKSADQIIALSENWKKYYANFIKKNKIKILSNAIDLKTTKNYLKPKSKRKFTQLLFVGRVEKIKGIWDLLEAMSYLENCKLNVMGPFIIPRKTIEAECKKLKIQNKVNFLGMVTSNKKFKYFNDADIFVLPSHFESFGIVLLEAMAFGLPIVATNVGGIPEVIKKNNGILFEKQNVKELIKSIKEISQNKNLIKKMSKSNFKLVEQKYSEEIFTNSLKQFYDDL